MMAIAGIETGGRDHEVVDVGEAGVNMTNGIAPKSRLRVDLMFESTDSSWTWLRGNSSPTLGTGNGAWNPRRVMTRGVTAKMTAQSLCGDLAAHHRTV